MKASVLTLTLGATSVLADVTPDPLVRSSLETFLVVPDSEAQLNLLTEYAQEHAIANGYDFVPEVDQEAVMDEAFFKTNPELVADLEEMQEFAYWSYPYVCAPNPSWYPVVGDVEYPVVNELSFEWILEKNPGPYTLEDYNNAIAGAYNLYAAQQAAHRIQNLDGPDSTVVIVNWPPPEPEGGCIPLVSITATSVLPGPTPGTTTISDDDGGYHVEITSVPATTETVPGPIAGTTTIEDPEGGFYVEVTLVPAFTSFIPGPTPGTTTIPDPEGEFYVEITGVIDSTTVVPGPTPGTTTIEDPDGGFYVEITSVPEAVSTSIVPGPEAGTTTVVDSDGSTYEIVTRTPVNQYCLWRSSRHCDSH